MLISGCERKQFEGQLGSSDEYESLQIPQELYEKLFKKSGAKDRIEVQQFILDLLEKAVSSESHQFSSEEEQEIKQRLKSLGYM